MDWEEGKEPRPQIKFAEPTSSVEIYMKEVTARVRNLECERIFESQLDQRSMKGVLPNNIFIVYLHPRWVLQFRFGSSESHIESVLYQLRFLHRLKGKPGINPFIGVVVSEITGSITSFLCEIPAKGNVFDIIADGIDTGHPVAWERREKWCRQVIQAVAEAHKQNLRIGILGETILRCIAIDAQDNVVLFSRFQKTFLYD